MHERPVRPPAEVRAQGSVVGEEHAPARVAIAIGHQADQLRLDLAERELDVVVAGEHHDLVAGGDELPERAEGLAVGICDPLKFGDGSAPGAGGEWLDLEEVDEVAIDDQLCAAAKLAPAPMHIVQEGAELVLVEEVLEREPVAEVEIADDRMVPNRVIWRRHTAEYLAPLLHSQEVRWEWNGNGSNTASSG